MKPISRNYHTALLFKGRPDVHMTLKYYKDLEEISLVKLISVVRGIMARHDVGPSSKQFPLSFNREGWFGAHNDVRVLLLEKDSFNIKEFFAIVTRFPPFVNILMDKHCNPHVACTDKSLDLVVEAVAIMYKEVIIARWDLKEN